MISKETFLHASDAKNRDALLFDLLRDIDKKINVVVQLKIDIAKCERQLAYIKGIGTSIAVIFSGLFGWLFKTS